MMHRFPFLLAACCGCALFFSGCAADPPAGRPVADASAAEIAQAKADREAAQRDAARKSAEIDQLTDRIAQAQKAQADAVAKSDRLAQLQAEKDELAATATLAGIQARDAKEREREALVGIKDKDKEISAERTAVAQERLYWFAGALGLAALIAVGVSIWMPLTRRWTGGFAVACGAVAALAVFVASILPWLWWIGAGLFVSGIGAALYWWHKDHHTAVQVVQAVETVKDKIPDFKSSFRQVIDGPIESWIDRIRGHLGFVYRPILPVTVQDSPMPPVSPPCPPYFPPSGTPPRPSTVASGPAIDPSVPMPQRPEIR